MFDFTVTILGLGLMGGSLARVLRPFVGCMRAVDRDERALQAALAEGVIDVSAETLSHLTFHPNDLLILATPVRHILSTLSDLPRWVPDGCRVLDLGSTKSEICAAMSALPPRFEALGGHPMCGREVNGYAAGSAELFQGATFALCETQRTSVALRALAMQLVVMIGSEGVMVSAELHDQTVALTSHLPYLLSVNLRLLAAAGEPRPLIEALSAGGLRDTTRLAASSPAIMGDILLTNRNAVLARIAQYEGLLSKLKAVLEGGSAEALMALLQQSAADQRQMTPHS